MLQQEQQEDFVIATGQQFTVRQFIEWSATALGIELKFEGAAENEIGIVVSATGESASRLNPGDVIVRVDPHYFRPAEVETLLGDPSKAKAKLGWVPEISVQEMCVEMIEADLRLARAEKAKRVALQGLKGAKGHDK